MTVGPHELYNVNEEAIVYAIAVLDEHLKRSKISTSGYVTVNVFLEDLGLKAEPQALFIDADYYLRQEICRRYKVAGWNHVDAHVLASEGKFNGKIQFNFKC